MDVYYINEVPGLGVNMAGTEMGERHILMKKTYFNYVRIVMFNDQRCSTEEISRNGNYKWIN